MQAAADDVPTRSSQDADEIELRINYKVCVRMAAYAHVTRRAACAWLHAHRLQGVCSLTPNPSLSPSLKPSSNPDPIPIPTSNLTLTLALALSLSRSLTLILVLTLTLNYKVCADCHEFFKASSTVLQRKLLVREPALELRALPYSYSYPNPNHKPNP